MRKTLITFITLLTTICNVKAQAPDAIWQLLKDGTIIRWAYSGGDEFNGTSLDDSKWSNSFPWGRNYSGTCSQEYMTDGLNYEFDNGILKLITKKEDVYARGVPYEADDYKLQDGGDNLRTWHYTSGMVFSKQKFKNGLFEIRFKPPVGKGLWPAFWLFGGNPDEEFDVFEYKGETPNKIHINVHQNGNMDPDEWVTANGNFSDSFNDMMGEWESGFCIWYLNGQSFAIWLGTLNYQANIIAGQGVAHDNCPFAPGPDNSTSFPATFEIDFIRTWTRLDCQAVINICNYNQSATDPTVLTGKQITMGGTNCDAIIQSGQNLDLIATDYIELKPGFEAVAGSNFSAKIIDCPGPSARIANPQSWSDSSMHIISGGNYPDSSSIYERKQATIDNPPVLYVKIFPNPSNGKITLEFVGKTDKSITIELTNSMGQKVFSKTNITETSLDIDISHFSKGVYFLNGIFGDKSISDKIVLN